MATWNHFQTDTFPIKSCHLSPASTHGGVYALHSMSHIICPRMLYYHLPQIRGIFSLAMGHPYVTTSHYPHAFDRMVMVKSRYFFQGLCQCLDAMNKYPGPRINIKTTSYQYRKSHCGDKTILRPPSYLHNGISYTGKMTSLYWIGALFYKQHLNFVEWYITQVWF